jgi:hypothetical protein
MKKPEPAQRAPSALEQCTVESSAGGLYEGIIVVKGLPPDHVQADCMGEYLHYDRTMNGRSVYVGGRDGDMALYFDNTDWVVTTEDDIGGGGCGMHVNDSAITPDGINAPWLVFQGHQPAPSVRVHKVVVGRSKLLEVSGLPSEHRAASCMGQYTRDACSHNGKLAYTGTGLAEGMAIWFSNGDWCIGPKKYLGTSTCNIFAEECARTPAAVQSIWMAATSAEHDERVQVGTLVQQSSSASANQAQQLSSAPPKLAIVGSDLEGKSCDGVYTKQQRETRGRVVYEGGRNGEQAMWYHQGRGSAG